MFNAVCENGHVFAEPEEGSAETEVVTSSDCRFCDEEFGVFRVPGLSAAVVASFFTGSDIVPAHPDFHPEVN